MSMSSSSSWSALGADLVRLALGALLEVLLEVMNLLRVSGCLGVAAGLAVEALNEIAIVASRLDARIDICVGTIL